MELTTAKQATKYNQVDKAYELSALIDADSFFYGLMDYGHRLMKSDTMSLSEVNSAKILDNDKAGLRKVKMAIINPLFTLIPKGDFSHDDIATYVDTACAIPDPEDYIYRSDYIASKALRICYAVPKQTLSTINDRFDNTSLIHYITAAIEHMSEVTDGLSITLVNDYMVTLATKDGSLITANIYNAPDTPSQLYYIGLVYQQTGLDRIGANLNISGTIDHQSELTLTLSRYFSDLKLDTPPLYFEDQKMGDSHQYVTLYAISQCA